MKSFSQHKWYFAGRNEAGQLGHGHTDRVDVPTVVSALEGLNIVQAACGKQHSLFVTGSKSTLHSVLVYTFTLISGFFHFMVPYAMKVLTFFSIQWYCSL